jgi:hypothetical protein
MADTPNPSRSAPPWADLLTAEVTPPWDHFRRPFDDLVSGIVTAAPPPEAAKPVTWEDMRAAMDRLLALPYERDRYVIPDSRWHRMMTEASPELRADLQSLRDNGTVIVSSMLPRPNGQETAYRITLPEEPTPTPRWS